MTSFTVMKNVLCRRQRLKMQTQNKQGRKKLSHPTLLPAAECLSRSPPFFPQLYFFFAILAQSKALTHICLH